MSQLLQHPPRPVWSVTHQQARPDGEAGEANLHHGLLYLPLGAGQDLEVEHNSNVDDIEDTEV